MNQSSSSSSTSRGILLKNRRILQVPVEEGALQSSGLSPDPIFRPPVNGSSSETSTKTNSRLPHSSTPFDSSMALTILVLLTALFFMGFFSIYIRRFSTEENSSDDLRRRRQPSRPATAPGASHQKGGGVDSSTVKALPLVSYRGGTKQLITDCSICLSEFEEGEIVKLIPHCRHVFHAQCLDTWLDSHVSCPLCRGTQFFKMADDAEVRLDVVEAEEIGNGGNEVGERSTVDDRDTWRDERMRRTGSCRRLGDRGVFLRRSMSF